MDVDEFTERLARVRQRFAGALQGKIDDAFTSLTHLSGDKAMAIETTIVTHRKLHEMCGIAPTIGFAETGKAARAAETVIRPAARDKRAPTLVEISALKDELDALRIAARTELQSIASQE